MKKITDFTRTGIIKISKLEFVRQAIEEKANLNAFKEKPSLVVIAGVFAICFSFVIGWPAVAALGTLSVYLDKPLIVLIGGPLTYGLSHLVFMFGMYLSGGTYTIIFFRWLTRVSMERLIVWSTTQIFHE